MYIPPDKLPNNPPVNIGFTGSGLILLKMLGAGSNKPPLKFRPPGKLENKVEGELVLANNPVPELLLKMLELNKLPG